MLTVGLALPTGRAGAQEQRGLQIGPLRVSGSAGVMAEGYRSSGIRSRRPGESGRVFARANAQAHGFRYTLDFLLSTEQSRFRQQFNRARLRVDRRTWTVAAGDQSLRMSEYGLNGTSVRGGLLQVRPGRWSATVVGGRSRRAVPVPLEAILGRPSFRQTLIAGHVKFEDSMGWILGVSGHVARDELDSISDSADLQPMDNVVLTPEFGFRLLEGLFRFRGEASFSAFSEDTRAPRTGKSSFGGLFVERTSSRLKTAIRLSGQVEPTEALSMTWTYDRIAPGYRSLGLARTTNDLESWSLNPELQLKPYELRLRARLRQRRNNLANQQLTESTWRDGDISASARFTPEVSATASVSGSFARSEPLDRTLGAPTIELNGITLAVSPTFQRQVGQMRHMVVSTLSHQSQDLGSAGTLRVAVGSVAYTAASPSGWSPRAFLNMVSTTSGFVDSRSLGFSAGASRTMMDRRLTASVTAGRASTSTTPRGRDKSNFVTWTFQSNATFRLPGGDIVSFQMRGLRSTRTGLGSSREVQSSLRYEKRL
jgi:hypothetical protein